MPNKCSSETANTAIFVTGAITLATLLIAARIEAGKQQGRSAWPASVALCAAPCYLAAPLIPLINSLSNLEKKQFSAFTFLMGNILFNIQSGYDFSRSPEKRPAQINLAACACFLITSAINMYQTATMTEEEATEKTPNRVQQYLLPSINATGSALFIANAIYQTALREDKSVTLINGLAMIVGAIFLTGNLLIMLSSYWKKAEMAQRDDEALLLGENTATTFVHVNVGSGDETEKPLSPDAEALDLFQPVIP